MQYIEKKIIEPADWVKCLTIQVYGDNDTVSEKRIYNYKDNGVGYIDTKAAKEILIEEQKGLCAYCQKDISKGNSTIEHVIPLSQSPNHQTNYHNLVAVCSNFTPDKSNRLHCDKSRGSLLLPPIIFHKDFTYPYPKELPLYFYSNPNGKISTPTFNPDKHNLSVYNQVVSFIEILNLNHDNLTDARANILREFERYLPGKSDKLKKKFWSDKKDEIMKQLKHPFRQFLLIYCHQQIHGLVTI